MQTKPKNVIAYGTRRRRSPWIMLGIVLCLLVPAIGLYLQLAPLLRWWSLVQLRHEVLGFTVPASTVLFRQQASDTEHSLLKSLPLQQARYAVPVKDRMEGRLFPIAGVSPGYPWTVLLHERWTPAGKHRVVLVEANVMLTPQRTYTRLSVQLFDAGSILHPGFTMLTVHPANGVHLSGEIPGFVGLLPSVATVRYGSEFQLLSGRPDPDDPSAFLIEMRDGEKGITITGRIADDGSLALSASDGSPLPLHIAPATKPSN